MTDSVFKGFDIASLIAAASALPVGQQKAKYCADVVTQIGSNPIYELQVGGVVKYRTTVSGALTSSSAGIALPTQFTEPPTVNLADGLTDAVEVIRHATNTSIEIRTPVKVGGGAGYLTASKALDGTWTVRTSTRNILAPATLDVSLGGGAVSGRQNGIWCFKQDILGYNGVANLQELVSKDVFNVYVNVGFPSPAQGSPTFPELSGFVPDSEIGLIVSQSEAQQMKTRLAQVDSRLKLWAWFGSFSTAGSGDLDGHFLAKMSVDTLARRTAIINACLTIMSGGHFYGAQDDNEDFKADSLESSGQQGSTVVTYFNEFATAFKAAGYPVHTFVYSGWYTFNNSFLGTLTEPTGIVMAGHNGTGSAWHDLAALFFLNVQRPIIYNFGFPGITADMVAGLEAYPYSSVASQIIGYSFYDFQGWTGNWAVWDNWTHKT